MVPSAAKADERGVHQRTVTRFAIAGMGLALLLLGGLAVWSTFGSERRTHALTQAGIQTAGHLHAAQALGQIDTHTDLLETGIDQDVLVQLRTAQTVLHSALHRMEHQSVVPSERRLAADSRDEVRDLMPAIAVYLDAVASGKAAAMLRAEEHMEDILDGLQLRFDDVSDGTAEALEEESAAAQAAGAQIKNATLVLVPLGFLFVALCGWQMRVYRRRSEASMLATLDLSLQDARTDALTGLGNRRALMEELEQRIADREPFVFALADLNGFKHYNDS